MPEWGNCTSGRIWCRILNQKPQLPIFAFNSNHSFSSIALFQTNKRVKISYHITVPGWNNLTFNCSKSSCWSCRSRSFIDRCLILLHEGSAASQYRQHWLLSTSSVSAGYESSSGVIVNDQLSATAHVSNILASCFRATVIIRITDPAQSPHSIYVATWVFRASVDLLRAIAVWWVFCCRPCSVGIIHQPM